MSGTATVTSPKRSSVPHPTLVKITQELASLTGDDYDDIQTAMACYPPRNRLRKAQQLLADARDRQHQLPGRLRSTSRPAGVHALSAWAWNFLSRVDRDDNDPHIVGLESARGKLQYQKVCSLRSRAVLFCPTAPSRAWWQLRDGISEHVYIQVPAEPAC